MAEAAKALSEQEKIFFSRAAMKVADDGVGFDEACAAVIADDRRIYARFARLDKFDRHYASHAIAHQVFAAVHARLSGLPLTPAVSA